VGQRKRDKLTEFNRGIILEAAKALFEEKGMPQTTMDDIAKQADVSKSTIYVYFRSKDEIYYTLIYDSMVMLKERLAGVLENNADFEETYFTICRMLADFQREHPLYFDGMMNEIGTSEEDFAQCPVLRDIFETGEETNAIMADALRRGMDSEFLKADLEPIPTIMTLWASLCGVIRMAEQKTVYFREKLSISKQQYLDYSFRMLLDSLR
jgi:AcrR family transcriptional regulator